ncbi:fimbria/pilus outer membrane usher protein [Herminiimonas aquatilis]|uniref:Fimbria/pilus outer membrane usher protein n=1 Tax=Herminiimonas aquatilis TaxID=345342 RepID=A0ABW2J2V2_9BURK
MRCCVIAALALNTPTVLAQSSATEARAIVPETMLTAPDNPSPKKISNATVIVLAIVINGIEQDDTSAILQLQKNEIAVAQTDLVKWNMPKPIAQEIIFEGFAYVRLSDIPDIEWKVNPKTQSLLINAKASAFSVYKIAVEDEKAPPLTASPLGGFFNYDVQAERSNRLNSVGGLYEFSLFGKWGFGSSSSLYRNNNGSSSNVRLDTSWTIDVPDKRQSVWLGDAISAGGTWGRSVRFGGIRWGTNFALSPGFSTLPLPTVRGETALPSTLDLYVNNSYGSQTTIPAGPFDLANVPLVTGKGEIRMAVRDVLGREQIIVQPYYASRALLKPGLHDFSIEAGRIREDYGFASNNYGRAFIAGTDRLGITPNFTTEIRGEILKSQQTVGAGGTWLLGTLGTVGVQGATSRTSAGNGWSSGISMDRQAPDISGSFIARYATRNFTQLGEIEGRSTKVSAALALGMSWLQGGIGASYAHQTTWQNDRNRLVALSYSRSLGQNAYFSLAATRQLDARSGTTFSLTLIHTLGTQGSISAVQTKDKNSSYTALQLQRNMPSGPGYGYQINADQSESRRYSALGTLQNAYTRLSGGVAHSDNDNAYRVGATGAVAVLGGSAFPTRRIEDSFAVVKVGDYDGISVLRDNQKVASTGDDGYAFITGLRGYEKNRISIDQADLPFDAEIDTLDMIITPAMRSGISVLFPVRRVQSATASLVTADGKPLPPGTEVIMQNQQKKSTVGFDGKIFISSVEKRVKLSARVNASHCYAEVDMIESSDTIPALGTVLCEERPQ